MDRLVDILINEELLRKQKELMNGKAQLNGEQENGENSENERRITMTTKVLTENKTGGGKMRNIIMNNYEFKQNDFENPSFLFILEDILKSFLGGPLLYNPYIKGFGLKGDEKVLDFGCGGGTGSQCLMKFLNENGHLTCVDISSFWMEKANRRLRKYSNAECKVGDIRKLCIPDSSFDVISIIHVIHDIEHAKRQDIVNVLSQKLKRGGALFIREPIKKSHGMPVEEIQTLLSNAGLKEAEHKENKSEYMGKFQKIVSFGTPQSLETLKEK